MGDIQLIHYNNIPSADQALLGRSPQESPPLRVEDAQDAHILIENEKTAKSVEEAQNFIQELIDEGPVLEGNPDSIQNFAKEETDGWVDEQLFKEGQEFFKAYSFACLVAAVLGTLFCIPYRPVYAALKRTGEFHASGNAFLSRLALTMEAFLKWINTESKGPQGEGSELSYTVWKTHHAHAKKLHDIPMPLLPGIDKRRREDMEAIRADIQAECKGEELPDSLLTYDPTEFITQLDHTMIMYGVMSLVPMCPQKFGIPANYSRRGLKGYLYAWYVSTKRLGVADKFNVGLMGQKEAEAIKDKIVLPSWKYLDEYSMHFFTSIDRKNYWNIFNGDLFVVCVKRLAYGAFLWLILHHVCELEMPEFKKKLSLLDRFFCSIALLIFALYGRSKLFRYFMNNILLLMVKVAVGLPLLLSK